MYGAVPHEFADWELGEILKKSPELMEEWHGANIEKTSSLEELLDYIDNNHIYIIGDFPEYSEHIKKRIYFAFKLKCPGLVQTQLGLRDKVTELFEQYQIEALEAPNPDEVKELINYRLEDLNLTPEELNTLTDKLDINTFASLDVAMEKPVTLCNLLPGVTTTYSYAGYQWEARPVSGFGYLNLLFRSQVAEIPQYISDKLKADVPENGKLDVKEHHAQWDDGYALQFFQSEPSKEWQEMMQRKPYMEYIQEWNERMQTLLQTAVEIPLWETGKLNWGQYEHNLSDAYTSQIYRKVFTPIYNWRKFTPMSEREYYYDYYISPYAQKIRDDFLGELQTTLQELREHFTASTLQNEIEEEI